MIVLYIVLALAAAVASSLCVSPEDWLAHRAAVLVAFGIQGAAILTRLGRGHPVGDISHLSLEQLNKLNGAVVRVATEQRNAALVTFGATLCTIGVNSALYLANKTAIRLHSNWPAIDANLIDVWSWRLLIGMTVFLVVAAFCHLPSIILQDIGLIKLQARFKKEGLEAARKKSAKEAAFKAELMMVLDEINASLKPPLPKQPFGQIINAPKKE